MTLTVVKPSEALGVYSDAEDPATASRFSSMDDTFREKLVDAMRQEDTMLRRYIEKNRLEDWCRTAVDGAKKAVDAEMDRLTGTQGTDVVGRLKWKLFGSR